MTPIFPQLPVALGAYKLTRMLGSHEDCDLYIAAQSHVDRLVVLEVMRPTSDAMTQQHFIASARARVANHLPHVAQVLESTQTKGYWHITHELPKGRSLATLLAEGGSLTPPQICRLILNMAELYSACRNADLAADTLRAEMVFITKSGAGTFLSPIAAGSAQDSPDTAVQMRLLAQVLRPVQPTQGPGRSRVATLLAWMEDGYEGQGLDWPAIASTARQIIEQLDSAALKVAPPPTYDGGKIERQGKKEKKDRRRGIAMAAIAAAAVVGMGAAGALFGPDTGAYNSPVSEGAVHCRIDGEANRMLARPVSIGDYRKFLKALETMPGSKISRLDSGIPPADCDHEPADWEQMLAAAGKKAEWNGRKLSMGSPVTNVSYWDALAYARYANGRLPEAAALQAVLSLDEIPDRGIDEWTASQSKAFGPYGAGYIVLPGTGDHPYPVANPSERAPRRGFRILLPR